MDKEHIEQIAKRLYKFACDYFGEMAWFSRRKFVLLECKCKGLKFREVTIARHPQDAVCDFKGKVTAVCETCGERNKVMSCLPMGDEDSVASTEIVTCECGSQKFYLGIMDLYDLDLPHFYDEGLTAAGCCQCGKSVIVENDD